MAHPGGRRRPAPGGKGARSGGARQAKRPAPQKPPAARNPKRVTPAAPSGASGPFRLGAVEGATPGRWMDIWQERMPDTPIELVPLTVADQRTPVVGGQVDAAIVRLPLDRDGLHVIPLYEEVPVVVCAADSHLTAADELTLDDLDGEVVFAAADDVLGLDVPGALTPAFAAPADTAEAVATVATGVGVIVVPMSLARLHHRRDVTFRPLQGGPVSPVALAWPAGDTAPLVEAFIGIVRGRTANSSRG